MTDDRGTQPSTAHGVLIQDPRPGARIRVFCLPCAGGGASMYHGWGKQAPPDLELCAVQPPGRETRFREPAFRAMAPLLQHIERCVYPYLDRPFALFGHSMGGLVAFELARQLEVRELPLPCHVFIAGHPAPHLARSTTSYQLPDHQLATRVRSWRGGAAPDPASRELLSLVLPCLRADLEALETYTAAREPAIECPISVFGGTADPQVTRQQLEAWQSYTRGAFRARMLPGDHFFVLRARDAIVDAIQRDLAAVTAR